MAEKMLRGKSPLTVYRGAGGPGGHLYRGSVLDPRLVDADDRARLVGEGHLEWVVPDGEGWKLAVDTDDGKAGDSVTVGDTGVVDPNEVDNGTVNPVVAPFDPEVEAKRAAARAKLPGDGSAPDGRAGEDVWREYAVKQGMDRVEVEKASKADLVGALKK